MSSTPGRDWSNSRLGSRGLGPSSAARAGSAPPAAATSSTSNSRSGTAGRRPLVVVPDLGACRKSAPCQPPRELSSHPASPQPPHVRLLFSRTSPTADMADGRTSRRRRASTEKNAASALRVSSCQVPTRRRHPPGPKGASTPGDRHRTECLPIRPGHSGLPIASSMSLRLARRGRGPSGLAATSGRGAPHRPTGAGWAAGSAPAGGRRERRG
jgi:hypothetical protein